MQDFIRRQNIKLLREAIEKERDRDQRLVLERLLDAEVRQESLAATGTAPKP